MEFLNINITKYLSLLPNAIHSPFYWRILKKTKLVLGLKNLLKKFAKQENSSIFMNSILYVERKNEGRKPGKTLSLRRLEFMPRNLD